MQQVTQDSTRVLVPGRIDSQPQVLRRWLMTLLPIAVVLFLAFYNLDDYPATWFDEGSHLHVPKTLVRFGVYADYSSDGFRYYGPTVGIGPTVMLPVAASLWLFGMGLLQARLVMALFLVGAIFVFYRLGKHMAGVGVAWLALVLLLTSRSVALLPTGRQLLGEVPGLMFILAGLLVWFAGWERPGWRRLSLVGLLLGLAMVTKLQYLLLLGPVLLLAWLANLVYYRQTPQRTFIVPGTIAGLCALAWQVYLVLYLGPSTAQENLRLLREATAGAALLLNPTLMVENFRHLISPGAYLGALLPAFVYGAFLAWPRTRSGQQWGILWLLVGFNLTWYTVTSIGWLRYAFPGLALASLLLARFFWDGLKTLSVARQTLPRTSLDGEGQPGLILNALRGVLVVWLALIVLMPGVRTLREMIAPPPHVPVMVAAYLNNNVPQDVLIETYELELGFLTDHHYHFPPPALLIQAVNHIAVGGPSPQKNYDILPTTSPPYVLVGPFGRWVSLYPETELAARYTSVTKIGEYELFKLKSH